MKQIKGVSLVLTTAVISGFSIFINTFGVKVINSDIYTFLKNLVSGLFIFGAILLVREFKQVKNLKSKDWGLLLLIGLIGGSLAFLLYFKGLAISTASTASMIHKTMFLPVALLALIFLKEKINKNLIIGILLMVIGNALLLKFNLHSVWQKGEWLVLAAVMLWSVENILSKVAVRNISPKIVAAGRMFFGCGIMLIIFLFNGEIGLMSGLSLNQIGWGILTGLILTAYQLTWYSGIKYIKISTASCLLAIGAPITTALTLFSGKALSLNQGFSLLIFAVATVIILLPGQVKEFANEKL